MRTSQPHRVYRFLLLLVAVVFVGAGCNQPSDVIESTGDGVGVDVGQEAPDFTLTSFEGEVVSLSDYDGQVIFLDFWAAWCPFCVNEIPEIQAIHESYPEVVVIGVHRTETEAVEDGQAFVDELGAMYTMLKDEDGSVYQTYSGGRPFMPLGIIIDQDGLVHQRFLGPKTAEQMKEPFMNLLGAEEL